MTPDLTSDQGFCPWIPLCPQTTVIGSRATALAMSPPASGSAVGLLGHGNEGQLYGLHTQRQTISIIYESRPALPLGYHISLSIASIRCGN